MLYELRIYRCAPGRLAEVSRRFEQIVLPLWERHGIRQKGFWTVVIGSDSNALHYLLEWQHLAERERKWQAFTQDPEWLAARDASDSGSPPVEAIANTILAPTSYSAHR